MKLFPTSEEQDKKLKQEEEIRKQIERKYYMKVILTLEKTTFHIDYVKAKRQDNVEHMTAFKNGTFYTSRLRRARRELIQEIELMTGRKVLIVLNFDE